jgi:hypothetical protein
MAVQQLYHHVGVHSESGAFLSRDRGFATGRHLKARPDKPVAVVSEDRIMMRAYAALLVLVAHCFICQMAAAAQSKDCKVVCRDDYNACVQAHTQGACKTNYDICVKHCPNK